MRPKAKASPAAEAVLDGLAAHIDDLLDGQHDLMEQGHHWEATPTSPLEQRKKALRLEVGPAGPWDGAEAEQVGRLTTLMLYVSGQHLDGIRALLLDRQVMYPTAPLARAILEATGWTFWLADPRVTDLREFAARRWMAEIDNATRQVTTAKAFATDQKGIAARVEAKKHLRNVQIPDRFHAGEIEDNDGRIVLCGQNAPGLSGSLKYIAAIAGVKDYYTPMYSYLSDTSHPTPYAALELIQNTGEGDLHQFTSPNLNREYQIIRAAVIAYQQAWLLTTAYFGQDTKAVEAVCDELEKAPKPDGIA